MGSTNRTTNYELSQFVGNDKPSWLSDYNGDMAKIDTAIKARSVEAGAAQTTADTANGKADALDTRMGTAENNITALQNASTTDHTQIATNTANISKNAQDIVQLDAKIGHTQITIGDHTVTGAIAELAEGKITVDDAESTTSENPLQNKVITLAMNAVRSLITAIQNLLGNTDISSVGDGTVTGAISALSQGGGLTAVAQATADGVKSTATLLGELHTQLADVTLNPNAVLVLDSGSGFIVFRLSETDPELGFTNVKSTSSDFYIQYVKIASTGTFYESTRAGTTDSSAFVRPSTQKFIVYN